MERKRLSKRSSLPFGSYNPKPPSEQVRYSQRRAEHRRRRAGENVSLGLNLNGRVHARLPRFLSDSEVVDNTSTASGAWDVVFEAEDIRLGRHVALKFLSEKVVQTKEAKSRFMREARALSALHYPNICTIFEVEEHEGRPVIVMELLEGKPLKEVLRNGPLPADSLRRLGIQLADALDAAHNKGIIHRDIKPGNIFVNDRGQAKILDFGVDRVRGMAGPRGSWSPRKD